MKNAKRILLFALTLVALTLVMSLSIFAEEATEPVACAHPVDAYDWNIVGCSECGTLAVLDEGSTNVSSNLGYTIYFATSLNDLSNTNYDVIRLKNNISLPSGGKITNANAIIDLGGNVLYRNGGYLGLRIVAAKGFVNGYVYKTNGGSQIMAVTSLEFMEDVTLAANSTKTNNATGLLMNTDGAYLGSMKNVTICAGILSDLNSNNFDFVNVGTNGIYNHGIEATKGTIGSMENVKISTYGQAITTAAKIGTMTNCVFSGDGMALNITTLQSEMVFVNCEIYSKNIAIYIANANDSTAEAPVSFVLGDTKIVTDGAVYALTDHIKDKEIFADLTSAVALVNGRLYTSLADAVDALNASTEEVTTFALIGDLAVDSTIVVDKKVNFSFGGATYNVPVYGTNQVVQQTASGYTVTSSVDVVFSVVEGGYLTISGDGRLEGTENAIVADGGVVVITAGTYVGYNPREFVSTESCVVNDEGVYTIAAEHDYDDEVGADKTNYQVDGVCNNCGFVRGIYAVDNVYYMTLEEAYAAALEKGKQLVLAADIVLDGEVVWDFTGATFNFNGLTVTVNGSLSIVGGTFSQDVSDYVSDEYCTYKNNNNLYVVVSEHTWGAAIGGTDATCTKPGTAIIACEKCGVETEEETEATLPHTYDWRIGGCPMCGTVAVPDVEGGKVSTNLGYSVYFAASWSEINANVSASSTYKVIKLTADTTVPSGNNYAKVQNANIYIDLGGHSITSSVGLAPLYLYAADALVNGTIIHNYGRQALYVCNVNLIENINLVMGGTYANNATGIYLAYNASYAAGFEGSTGSYIGAMKNVTIDSKRDENGNYIENIGLFNHGIEFSNANSIIGDLENVKVYSRGQALTLMAKEIGTMTNCVFDGTNIGLNIGNLQCDINLVNCVVSSETLAVRIGDASSDALTFNFDANTAISSKGSVYYIPDSIKSYAGFESLTTAVALVNGVLYGTLEDALAAVLASTEEVTTFTLIGDLTLDAPIVINKVVAFSFGGGTFKIPTTGDKTFTEMTAAGYTVTALNGAFVVVEGGALTISGDGTLVGNENAIVANGGSVLVEAGTYEGFNPQAFVAGDACVVNNEGVYTITTHKYDDGVMSDKVTYKVDGDCEVCGYVRGSYAVNYVYYATLEEAMAAATESGYSIVLATDIVLENETVWDLAGFTFNFNGRSVTGNLSIVGGTFSTDVTAYLADGYCSKYVAKQGYVVSVHEFVAGAPAADGSITYTCAGCDETYVINNSAINGTYYDSAMNAYVFADGVLSAMGNTCNYTYNVTSGMIETDAGIFFQVVDGVICIRGAQPLHQHTGEGYIAEAQADGSINYVCPSCGTVMYVINNSAINGTYYDNAMNAYVFADGVLSAMGNTCNYTYNVTSGMIETDAGIFFQVVDGVICVRGAQPLHQHVEGGYITEVTEPTCTDKGYTTYICQFCGPLFTDDETDALGHSYVESERTETKIFYVCTECGDSYSEDVITHTHTEVEIPAVLPTPSVTGYTAGIMCSDCGETLVAPVAINVTEMADTKDPNFRVASASLDLAESICVFYKAVVTEGYNNAYMVFVFGGEEFVVTEYSVEAGTGRYVYRFTGAPAYKMAENIEAYVYAETSTGEYSVNKVLEYSVMTYCVNQLKKNASDAMYVRVISDVLTLGAANQVFEGYNTNSLVTDLVEAQGYTLTPTAFDSINAPTNAQALTGDRTQGVDWKSAGMLLGSNIKVQLKFETDFVNDVTVKINVAGEDRYFTAEDFTMDGERYVVTIDYLTSKQYDEVITGTFYVDGEQIGSTLTYSVNSYIARNLTATGSKLTLLKAIYVYGETMKEFFK